MYPKKWLKKRRAEMSMGHLFIVFLLIVFALALTPAIGDMTYSVLWNDTNVTVRIANNVSGAARDIVSLVPLTWVFIVVGIGAVAVVKMFEDL
jgi:hypothetical protein